MIGSYYSQNADKLMFIALARILRWKTAGNNYVIMNSRETLLA